MQSYIISKPVFITYVPTFNSIDTARFLKTRITAYICYHNFDSDVVVKDLLVAEKEIIATADVLFADSNFLINRLKVLANDKEVFASPPGVHFDLFSLAFRGDEVQVRKKICFYGGAGPHLDITIYNTLCDKFEVIFIAVINPAIKSLLDKRIRIMDPVSNEELPSLLKEMDILTIFYKRSDYIDAVLPAKFFECIATGKPVLVSGLQESKYYDDCVYEIPNSPEAALKTIENLQITHTSERIQKQFALGKSADFTQRFETVYRKIMDVYNSHTFNN